MKAHQDTNEETKNFFEIVANDESSILDENLKTSINNISSCSSDNSDSDSSMDSSISIVGNSIFLLINWIVSPFFT